MKKILVLVVFCFLSISLYAQKPLIKFIDLKGQETKYNLEDISEIDFVKTNALSTMTVYQKDTSSKFLTANIGSIEFVDSYKLKINLQKSSKIFYIAEIDSITIIADDCSEVTIGEQTWTCKNLDVDHYRNGDPIPEVRDSTEWANLKTGAWCYYNNDPKLGAIYGKLYNWYAVNDPRSLAPEGWHIPKDDEWNSLINYLGKEEVAGGKLKSTGLLDTGDGLWNTYNIGGNNLSGFAAIPGGMRWTDGIFYYINARAVIWTATDLLNIGDNIPTLIYANGQVYWTPNRYSNGLSVRCVKDLECQPPILNSISPDSAYIGDVVTLKGENFCPPQRNSFVSFNDLKVPQSDYLSWSENEIKVKVPLNAVLGKISVTVYRVRSNELDFNVKRNFNYSTVTDYDGNVYKTLKLGGNWWMESNLKVKHYRNGDPIPEVKDGTEWSNLKTGAWSDYNNDPAMEANYGALYNWFTVNDPRGLAPEGWHVANDAEWNALIDSLGGKDIAGSKLKDVRNDFWLTHNADATNESGFFVKPAGQRGYQGAFNYLGYFSYWWAYQEYDIKMARLKRLYYDCGWVGSYDYYKYYGYSVRCVKDIGTPTLPKINSVSPDPVSMGDILTISGENFGAIQDTNFLSIYSKKIPNNFYQSWSNTEIKVRMPKGASQSTASVTVNGWKSNDVKFTVINTSYPPKIIHISSDTTILTDIITIKGNNFGELIDSGFVMFNDIKPPKSNYISWNDSLIVLKIPVEFIKGNITVNVYGTKSADYYYAIKPIEYSTVTDIDGNIYKTVKIGTQWWMAENLKVSRYLNGDTIPEMKDSKEWAKLTTPSWCNYNNDPKNGEIFGKLYNFYTLNDIRRIAPKGWHVPSEGEWNVLLNYCGGESIAGGKLKSTGTIKNGDGLWNSPNYAATNAAGFSIIPGGERKADGSYIEINNTAYFWTMNKLGAAKPIFKFFPNDRAAYYSSYCAYQNAMSVRCVKDSEFPPHINSINSDTIAIVEVLTISGENFGNKQGEGFVTLNEYQFKQSDYQIWSNNEIKIKIPIGVTSGNLLVNVNGSISNGMNVIVIKFRLGNTTDIDGNKYKTIKIGNQIWIAGNLNTARYKNGELIPEITDRVEWASAKGGAWCYYNNDPLLGAMYGKLYNWYAINDPRGLALEGWHIPKSEEWDTLINFVGGKDVAGGKLKEFGKTNWETPNTDATDQYGFCALPGGMRDHVGLFLNQQKHAPFWSSSNKDKNAVYYLFTFNKSSSFTYFYDYYYGFSVRCVKD